MTKAKRDIKQEVTDRIIAALEAGTTPWIQSWSGGTVFGNPVNGSTGRAYNGMNVMLLALTAFERGYASNEWMTFKQAKGMKGSVRKGEKGTLVVFWKVITKEDADGTEKKIFFLKHFVVFNAEQIDGLPVVETVEEEVTVAERHERAEALIVATGAKVTYGSGQASYSPHGDVIHMPAIEQFNTEGNYYSTHLHELAHWTGAPSRLSRELSTGSGTESYGREELVAELASAFLCAEIGIEGKLQHAEYLGSWIKTLKADKNAIFSANSAATKAANFLLGFEAEEEEAVAVAA